jgi:hypothetical protein
LYLSCVFDENNSRRNENGLIKNLHGAIYFFSICKINVKHIVIPKSYSGLPGFLHSSPQHAC